MNIDEKRIAAIVEQVLKSLPQTQAAPAPSNSQASVLEIAKKIVNCASSNGIFSDIAQGIAAAKAAQQELAKLPLSRRTEFVNAIRRASIENVEKIAALAHEETGYGRIADKIQKKLYAAKLTPGVEDLKVAAETGDGGLILNERAPFGVIASIEPATHPGSCIINHAISMIAAGNAIVFLPHPRGIRVAIELVKIFNQAVIKVGGPANLLVVSHKVTEDNFDIALQHPDIDLVVATGGPFVVDKALRSGKKAIGAGPGNPPAVVDETVDDLSSAAKAIVDGASFDNTVLCIAEKVIIAVESIADELLLHLEQAGAYLANSADIEKITQTVLPDGKRMAPDLIGRDAAVILQRAGLAYTGDPRLVILDVDANHPLVMLEQLLPVVPVVRVPDFDEALQLAVKAEQGFRHTAVIHSQDVKRITRYAKALKVDILVANAPSGAGLAINAEGNFSHTIASPTGEGICTPRTYTREQRTILAGTLYTV